MELFQDQLVFRKPDFVLPFTPAEFISERISQTLEGLGYPLPLGPSPDEIMASRFEIPEQNQRTRGLEV